jgi:hypothetical protein
MNLKLFFFFVCVCDCVYQKDMCVNKGLWFCINRKMVLSSYIFIFLFSRQ